MPARRPRRGIVSGYLLKLIRETIPRTQEALAHDLGVDIATVQGWESGRRPFTAMAFGSAISISHHLTRLGADPWLLLALHDTAEADYVLEQVTALDGRRADLGSHPLGAGVLTHAVPQMLAWVLLGHEPARVSAHRAHASRRGPVARAPELAMAEKSAFFDNLRVVAERSRHDQTATLLHRQACFVAGFDTSGHSTIWLEDTAKRRVLPASATWSPLWPDVRSVATSCARQGDPEPLRRYLARAYDNDTAQMAELNYWAYWVGEIPVRQREDSFMVRPARWHGGLLLDHLTTRLEPTHPLIELNVHTLHALLQARPHLAQEEKARSYRLATQCQRIEATPDVSAVARTRAASLVQDLQAR